MRDPLILVAGWLLGNALWLIFDIKAYPPAFFSVIAAWICIKAAGEFHRK